MPFVFPFWQRLLLAALSGVLYFVSFVGFDQWYLSFVAWVPLFVAIEGLSWKGILLLGWVMGTVTNLGGYYWIPGTIVTYGGFPWPLAILLDFLLCAYQGLGFALIPVVIRLLKGPGPESIVVGGIVFAAVEQVYPRLFPSYSGNALYWVLPAIQSVDLFGVLFITFLLGAFNLAVAHVLRVYLLKAASLRHKELIFVGCLWVVNLLYGVVALFDQQARDEASPRVKVGVVQANMGLFEKRGDAEESLRRHRALSRKLEREGARLLVWSESAVSAGIPSTARSLKKAILGELSTPLIFGALRSDAPARAGGRARVFNTAFMLDGAGKVLGWYDKMYLLAFGEYLPFGETFPVLYDWSPNSGRFTPGSSYRPIRWGPHRVGVMICYEDILPHVARRMVASREPWGEVDLLVNITNDAWFGKTEEPWIHLGLAVFRSIEQRKWLIRATNSGVSAAVSPTGRIVAATGLMRQDAFVVDAAFRRDRTVYQRGGWLFGYLCVAAVLFLFVFRFRAARSGTARDRKSRIS